MGLFSYKKIELAVKAKYCTISWRKLARTIVIKTKKTPNGVFFVFRAGKGVRTLDIDLGKVALYQLSYSRESFPNLIKKRTL